ncbi:nitronate monooxygenase [Alloalcanivorax xenomutans]|uniref:NAD(P)H-dependent flavin oxidoreductase n=1 Tax=Alloalcanivorax xenomutans TaxID=1094342 RepID=UPI003A812E44
MWKANRITQLLELQIPLIQGPFGGGLSSVTLAATVSQAGGLGSFGAHHLMPTEIVATATAIRRYTDRPFALNLWIPPHDAASPADVQRGAELLAPYYRELGLTPPELPQSDYWPDYGEQVAAILEARPAVFSFVYGIPEPAILAACRQRGIRTLGTATTVAEALALQDAGVDAVVATGFEAGGHRVSFMEQPERCLTGSLALIPNVRDALTVPVVAAGGIADGRGMAAAMLLGADAVQMGTAFLACQESNASPIHRRMLFSDRAASTGLSRAFSGRLARGIRNRFMDTMEDQQGIPGYPLQTWLTRPLKQAAQQQDDPEYLALWAGQATPLLRHRQAEVLINTLVSDCRKNLPATLRD